MWTELLPRDKKVAEPINGEVTIALDARLEQLLGRVGKMLSGSKSTYSDRHPDHEVYFNACIFNEAGEEVWCGDLDLTTEMDKIQAAADELSLSLYVTREHPYRWEGLRKGLLAELRFEKAARHAWLITPHAAPVRPSRTPTRSFSQWRADRRAERAEAKRIKALRTERAKRV